MATIQSTQPHWTHDIPEGPGEEGFILSVRKIWDDKSYEIEWSDNPNDTSGWCIAACEVAVTDEALGFPPEAGDNIALYGKGIGYPVRGIAILDRVIFYQSEADFQLEREIRQVIRDGFMRDEFERGWPERWEKIHALPQEFQDKLARMMKNRPGNIHKNLLYELFCCEQAFALAKGLGSSEAIRQWKATKTEDKAAVPGWNDYEHSGNTYDFSVMLAQIYLDNPEEVVNTHAAISPICGCIEAGCHTAEDFRTPEPDPEEEQELAAENKTIQELEQKIRDLENEIEEWQDASGLVGGGGDPSTVTPKQLEAYVGELSRCAWNLEALLDQVLSPRVPFGNDRYILPENEYAKVDRYTVDNAQEALDGLTKDEGETIHGRAV